MFTVGINELPDFLFEEYYNKRLFEIPLNSLVQVLSHYDFEAYNIVYVLERFNEDEVIVNKHLFLFQDEYREVEGFFKEFNFYEKDKSDSELSYRNSIISKKFHDKELTIETAINEIESICNRFISFYESSKNNKLSRYIKENILSKLPIYEKALTQVVMEIKSMASELGTEMCEIVAISSRLKSIDSIEEKVFRKKISQYEIFEKFNDIAGARFVCQYMNDVYKLLEYIKKNPLIDIIEIDDKILNPTSDGYRGIHIICKNKVFFNAEMHENILVEIQLRTSFQDAWSMKTHTLTYKKDINIQPKTSKKMKELSDLLFGADKTAQELKDINK